jgi:predicted house-cleaning noncanonical NTP pyrophosphatase (MazG superfamily)
MPFAPDKIIINNNRTKGGHAAIAAEYKSLMQLGAEIEAAGWTKETGPQRDKMAALCAAHEAADDAYLAGLKAMVSELQQFIDGHA